MSSLATTCAPFCKPSHMLKSSMKMASLCRSCGSVIHGSSDLNFRLQAAEFILMRMGHLRGGGEGASS